MWLSGAFCFSGISSGNYVSSTDRNISAIGWITMRFCTVLFCKISVGQEKKQQHSQMSEASAISLLSTDKL